LVDPEPAIRSLYDTHGAALYRYARSKLADQRDAEEVVQEALVRAWRHSHTFDPARGSERAWLFGITRNLIADHHRPRRLRLVSFDGAIDLREGAEDGEIERIVETTLVADALGALSPEHREVVVSAYYRGRTTAQIAQDMGVPQGTVKSRLFYALRALRLGLEERGVIR
jgi:RNA polymerase sigma-70 factor (ECF subfamily)